MFSTYLRLLWRRGWIVALVMALTAASALVFSLIVKERAPIYRSTVEVLVQPARSDFGLVQSAKILLDSYVAWMYSDYRAAEVIDRLKLDMTPTDLRTNVKIASEAQRLVITIEVDNGNGNVANDIAREWAAVFIEWRNEENQKNRREDRIDAQMIDDPRYELFFPKTGINTAAGAMLGLLLGGAVVLILEYIEAGVVRTPDDVTRFLEMGVLGVIPPQDD
jgi:capsular polysaccharide biosynthesis protein